MSKTALKTSTAPASVLDAINGSNQNDNQENNMPALEPREALGHTPDQTIPNILDGEQPNAAPQVDGNQPTDEKPAAPAAWGGFKVEVGVEPPKTGGVQKYDWAAFPAPSDPNDSKTWPSVFVPNVGSKTLSASANAFREKLQKEGKTAPTFRFSVSKDPKGVRVFRAS